MFLLKIKSQSIFQHMSELVTEALATEALVTEALPTEALATEAGRTSSSSWVRRWWSCGDDVISMSGQ